MWMVIGMTSIGVFIVSIIGTLVCLFSKNRNWRKWLAIAGVFFVLFFVAVSSDTPSYKESEEALQLGKSQIEKGDLQSAILTLETVDPKSPQYIEASRLISATSMKIDESRIQAGKESLSKGDYEWAITLFEKIASSSTFYSEARNLIAEARSKEADSLIAAGKALLTKGNYLDSINKFKKVSESVPQYSTAQSLIKEANDKHGQRLFSESKALVAKNDFDGAKSKLDEALSYNPGITGGADYYREIEKKRDAYAEVLKQKETDAYKNSCKTIEYRVLNKNPDSFAGTRIKLRGQIMQIMETNGSTFLLLQVTYTSFGYGYGSWDDNVAVFFDGTFDAYDDDIITIWGEVRGSYSYESVAGFNITIPSVDASYVQYPKH